MQYPYPHLGICLNGCFFSFRFCPFSRVLHPISRSCSLYVNSRCCTRTAGIATEVPGRVSEDLQISEKYWVRVTTGKLHPVCFCTKSPLPSISCLTCRSAIGRRRHRIAPSTSCKLHHCRTGHRSEWRPASGPQCHSGNIFEVGAGVSRRQLVDHVRAPNVNNSSAT